MTATLAALLAVGCGSGDGSAVEKAPVTPPPPGVSALSYSPKPYSKDMTKMRVRFTTTNAAGPGRTYKVWLFTGLDHRDRRCYPEFGTDDPIRGGLGKTVEVSLMTDAPDSVRDEDLAEVGPNDTHACAGRARLVIWTTNREGAWDAVPMRKLVLTILPPRS